MVKYHCKIEPKSLPKVQYLLLLCKLNSQIVYTVQFVLSMLVVCVIIDDVC